MATVNTVILTANRRALLARCLASLAAGRRVPDRVVVVVNETKDDTRAFLEGTDFPFPLTVVDGPGGSFAEARNAGVAACDGDVVAFLDDDCEADAWWLERALAAMEAHEWAATGGPVIPADPLPSPDWYAPEMAWAIGCSTPGLYGSFGGRREIPSTSNMLVRRELCLRIPFRTVRTPRGSEAWGYHAGGEDAQFWREVRRSGARTGIAARAIVWHHVGEDRLDEEALLERAEMDGASFWAREHRQDAVQTAARDIVNAPIHALADTFAGRGSLTENWERQVPWLRRQVSFLRTAVADHDHGVPPTTRSAAYLKETARAVLALAKGAARHGIRTAYTAWRTVDPVPTVRRPPRRVVVVLHDMLGDAILAIPMLRQLATAFPKARISVLTGPVSAPVLRPSLPEEIRVVELPRGTGIRGLWRELGAAGPDLIVVAYCHGISPLPLFFSGNAPVIGWNADNGFSQQLWRDLLTVSVAKDFAKSEGVGLLDLLAPLGIETRVERPRVVVSAAARERRERLLEAAGAAPGRYAVLQVEAETREKFWPVERFFAVADRLHERGLSVFLDGMPAGRVAAEKFLASRPWCHAVHGLLDTGELAALLEESVLFVGGDSGPAHLARALDVPAVLLYGMSDFARWRPMMALPGEELAPLELLEGSPGDWIDEEKEGLSLNEGLRLLSPEPVIAAVERILGGEVKDWARAETH